MSLQVNFSTHGHELKAAYEAILQPADPKKGNNWALFGYDKGTNDLKVLGQGSGGLEELQDEFVDGKIQYAFARIVDPYSQLNKFVFIAWCGDGVPESKKGLFNTHLADVANFLKGYHLQINARCEADVTPEQIMKRAEEGSGSKYSTHQEDYKPERIQPLQSAYKRTVIPDIGAMQRNPTKPESAPQYNIGGTKPLVSPIKPLVSPKPLVNPTTPSSNFSSSTPAPSKLVGRVWPPPATTQSSSSSTPSSNADSSPSGSTTAKSWKSVGGGSSYSAASTGTSFIKVQPPSSLTSYGRTSPEPPVMNKAHQLRLEREAREKEERERIKREIAASEARERQVDTPSTAQKVAEERRLQEQREREREQEQQKSRQPEDTPRAPGFNRVRQERELREKEERKRAEAEEASRGVREVAKAREQSAILEQATAREEEEQRRQRELKQRHEREAKELEERKAQEDEARRRQQEEGERERLEELQQEDEARRRKQAEDEERRLKQQKQEEERRLRQQQEEEEEEERQRRYEQEREERRLQEEAEERERALEQEVSAATAHTLHASADHSGAATSGSVSAIVLYSYEKSEENEMSLIEGEIIRNVTELDVGWWSGESEDGTRSGLFPANYVELVESAAATAGSHEHEQHYQEHEDEPTSSHHDNAHEQSGAHGAASQKSSAVALYDYQAGEPNEISFAEGETIVDIDFVTDDWWSGKNENGGVGLFPANYVELVTR